MTTYRNRFRIIAGRWRGRSLNFPDGEGLRPTGDRVRETLFNWLQRDITDARCLDAFTGSGALALEALSRGAANVVALDTALPAIEALRTHARHLDAGGLQAIQNSALDYLQHRGDQAPFDLIFLDPPFALDLLAPSLALIAREQWLKPSGKVYIESASPLSSLPLPAGWQWVKEKKAGHVYFGLAAPLSE